MPSPGNRLPDSSLPVAAVFALAFSPDGKALLAASADGSIGRWDLESPQASFVELPRQKGGVWSAAYSPDGRWLATGSKLDDTFAVWDLTRADAEPVLESDPEPAAAGSGPPVDQWGGVPVAFSPDGRTLATGGLNGTIWLWHLGDHARPFASLRGHRGGLLALDFYDHGKHLASSGEDGTIRLWSLDEPSAAPVVLQNGSAPGYSLDVGSDDRTLAFGGPGSIMLWKLDAPAAPPVAIPAGYIFQVALGPDGKRLASAATSSALRLWDLGSTGRPLVLKGPTGFIELAFSPDGALLASGGRSEDGKIRLWRWGELDAPPVVLDAHAHERTINSLRFAADSKSLLSASWDGNSIRLWDLRKPTLSSTALALADGTEPWTALFGPDGRNVFATGATGVYSWDLADLTGHPKLVLPIDNWGSELAFSPDGNELAVAGWFPEIDLKDLKRPDQPVSALRGLNERGVWSVAFSPDGSKLASGGRDGTVRLWNLAAPDRPSMLLGRHDRDVIRVRFSPDGKQLASASMDRSVRLWDVEHPDAVPIVLTGHEDEVWSLAYSPDGKYLVSGDRDGTARIWDLTQPLNAATTQQVADMVCQKVWRNLSLDEWHKLVGEDIPYQRTCPNLPIHPSLFEAAGKLAKAGDLAGATALLARAQEIDPDLHLDPKAEAQRLAASGKK